MDLIVAVNSITTYYNTSDGVILSQTDGTNTWYFQYDTNGIPLGFIYNGTQYFYMTNQMGCVIASFFIFFALIIMVDIYCFERWDSPRTYVGPYPFFAYVVPFAIISIVLISAEIHRVEKNYKN